MSKIKDKKTAGKENIQRNWYIIDAASGNFGRLASKAATLLRGKNRSDFTPHIDQGGYVVFVNCDNLKFTKDKGKTKIYYRFSGYPGGIKSISLEDQIKKDSRKVIEKAVYGMLPNNKMRDKIIRRLKIYRDDNHPYKDKFNN